MAGTPTFAVAMGRCAGCARPAILAVDPDLPLPPKSWQLYNFLSAPGFAVNVKTEEAIFTLREGRLKARRQH